MKTLDDYILLIPSEHRNKPRFQAAVLALVKGLMDSANNTSALPDNFDLDRAVGAQLDVLGLWVGVGRQVPVPITGVYFAWDTAGLGWESGYWQGPFDPSTGLVSVDDETYRSMIRGRIAANIWDGTIAGAYLAWALVFGPNAILIQDNQDMTMTLIYDTTILNPTQIALLIGGYFKLKPAGVLLNYTPVSSSPLFSWDRNLPKFQGWTGTSVWT